MHCETILETGIASSIILEMIEAKKIDLAVLGTNALHGFERLVFGSTAEAVLRKAPCPVLTVGPRVGSCAETRQARRARLFSPPTSTSPPSTRSAMPRASPI